MRYTWPAVPVLLAAVLMTAPAPAQKKAKSKKTPPLVERVKTAIDKGVAFLKRKQRPNGGWIAGPNLQFNTGGSCLALLALLESGVPVSDPAVQTALRHIRKIKQQFTYTVALQTMALAKAGEAVGRDARIVVDRERIKSNVKWLLKARYFTDGDLVGWDYGGTPRKRADGSNTQYALLGLWAAKEYGIKIDQKVWKSILDHYIQTQEKDGAEGYWYYQNKRNLFGGSHITMTTAGVCGLLIAGMEWKEGREQLQKNGPAKNCGLYRDNRHLARGLNYLKNHFQKELPGRTFYNLYGIERAGRLSGLRFFGDHDWYREGCEYLTRIQHPAGDWWLNAPRRFDHDKHPIISTSFALLFLSKGRTPILISRLVHGDWPRNAADIDWNRDRHALRNLTRFVSKNLFKRLPLGWQNFDIRRAIMARDGAKSEDDISKITSDLLQSPVVFISGHESPAKRFSEKEIHILQKYVENGGFIIAEACCGKSAFDFGIHKLVQQSLFPDSKLVDLPATHPIWKAHYPVKPGTFKLKGLQMGCKTVLVYAPKDMSCRWEANLADKDAHDGKQAFRLAANIIAYATGLEPPKPRLTKTALVAVRTATPPRGYFKAAHLKYDGDWQPAPNAMRNLMSHLQKYAGLDAALKPETMFVYNPNIVEYKFLYLHGRGDPKFSKLSKKDLKHLQFNLKTGGLLLADACCGNETFDKKFRSFVSQLLPKQKLKRVSLTDVLFSKKLNGVRLSDRNIRCRRTRGGKMSPAEPYLEGIQIDGRWVLLYSKYDIGCALERHQSSDCRGYDYASAKKIAGAAALYLLRP